MTATADNPPHRHRLRRVLTRCATVWGHHSRSWSTPAAVFCAVYLIARWWYPMDSSPLWVAALLVAAMTVVVVSMITGDLSQRVHDRNLCLRCLNQAPLLDPAAAVQRKLRLLRYFHSPIRRRLLWVTVPVAVFIALWSGPLPLGPRIVATLAASGLVLNMIRSDRAVNVHRRLHPWCPLCRHGRGRGFHPDPAPTPDRPAGANQ